MKASKLIKIAFFFACYVLFKGCASTPDVSTKNQLLARVSPPPPGKTAVYLFRQPSNQTSSQPLEISVDNAVVGRLEKKTYLFIFLEPGAHEIETAMVFPNGERFVCCKKNLKIVDAGNVLYMKLALEQAKGVSFPGGLRSLTINQEDFQVSSSNPFAFMQIPEDQGLKLLNSLKLADNVTSAVGK